MNASILWSLREGERVALLLTRLRLPTTTRQLSDLMSRHRASCVSCGDIFGSGQLVKLLQRPQLRRYGRRLGILSIARRVDSRLFKCKALICNVPASNNHCSSMIYAKYDATTPVLLFLVSPDSSSLAVAYDLSLLLVDIISAAICRSGRISVTLRLTFPSRFDLIASCSSSS